MLRLPGDMPPESAPLADVLDQSDPLAAAIWTIAAAMPKLAKRLASGHLPGNPAAIVGQNETGDKQKALDVAAHDYMIDALRQADVRLVLSEEAIEIETLNPDGRFDVAMDPIDGSGSIGIGAPLGMLFAIYPVTDAPFPRAGRDIIAAGYCSFGHSVDFGWSMGDGVHTATFDPVTEQFLISHGDLEVPETTKVIAYNASNERHWDAGLQAYVGDIRLGADGPRGKNFNMRWLAAAVGELHRILMQGGAFLYPADARPGYENGKLRLIYEAIPMAYLIEQAGGMATDGTNRILDIEATDGHQNTGLIFGASEEVKLIARHLTDSAKG